MFTTQFTLTSIALLTALFGTGCPSGEQSGSNPDAAPLAAGGAAGGATGAGGSAGGAADPEPPKSPLAATCTSSGECASGFCVDGVCCDSACDGTCYSCNLVGGIGHCGPQGQGEDENASVACGGTSTCIIAGTTGQPACKLKDEQKCSADADCASGHCRTFFRDSDADGFGTASSSLSVCVPLTAAAPAGYSTVSGDCCDSDSSAHPGVTVYSTTPDACASFDYNCSGTADLQLACPQNANLACGQDCYESVAGLRLKLFTAACN
jgi:hypothetical protein